MSATYDKGTLLPCASSIIRLRIRSIVLRFSSAERTMRLNERPFSYTCDTTSPPMFTVTNSLNCGNEMPYRANISRFGSIFSSGRSICCSTFRSATPSTSLTADLIWLPIWYILFRSSPNSLMAMPACVPLNMASIRWLMGCPISMFAPDMTDSLCRTSSKTSVWLRSSSSNGASISDTFTPRACSSSSARPVLRATVLISGMESNSSSACRPILSDSSKEIPGRELIFMVNEPSLNGGKKLRPNVRKLPKAATKSVSVVPSTIFLCDKAQDSPFW